IGIALPFLAFTAATGDFDVVTGDVAGHEGQAGYADAGEVVIVAHLPGAFLDVGEVVDLHEVDQERVAAGDIGERIVTAHALVAGAEGVTTQAVGEHGAKGLVVQVAEVAVLAAS